MNEEPGSVERLLAGLGPPEPPRGLQEKTLRGAREALAREVGRDLWTRMWENRALRISWAAVVVVLAICHVGITGLRSGQPPAAQRAARSPRGADGEVAAIGRLPQLNEGARPLLGVEAYRLLEVEASSPEKRVKDKGKESAS